MTIATKVRERVGRAPVQKLAELRCDEQTAIASIARKATELAACRMEIGLAAERRDRLAVYRFSDLQGALVDSIERESRAALRLVRANTPAFTGEFPLPDGCMGDGGRAA